MNDSVFITSAPDDATVFDKDKLVAIADITERAWQISNIQKHKGDDLLVASLAWSDS